jgi:flagellar hook-length control protein FliK
MTSFPFDLTAAPAKFDPTSLTRSGAAGSDAIDESLFQLHLRPPSSSLSSGSSYGASGSATNHPSNSTSASSARSSDEAAKSHREEESDSDGSRDASPHNVEDSGAAASADDAARGDDEERDSRQSDDDEQASEDDGGAAAAGDEKQSNREAGQTAAVEHSSEATGAPSPGAQRKSGGDGQAKATHAETQNPSGAVEGTPTAVGKTIEDEDSQATSASTTDEEGAKKNVELVVKDPQSGQHDKGDDRAAGRKDAVEQSRSAKDGEPQSGVTTGSPGETTASPDAAVVETPQRQTNGDAPRRDRRSRPQVQPSRAVTNQSAAPTAAQATTTPAEKAVVELMADETTTDNSGKSPTVASAEPNHDATPAAQRPAGGEAAPASASGSGRLSQQLVSHARQAGGNAPQLTEAHQTRLINRVARAFQSAGEGGGEVRLRLSPPELGSLRLEVKIHSGVLSAHIEADTPTARTLLLHNLHVLRERLEQQNIRVEQFDVDLSDRQPGNLPDDPRDAHRQQSPRPRELSSSVEGDAVVNETPHPGNAAVGGNDQLNVIV